MTRISRVLFLGSVVLIEHYPSARRRAVYQGFSRLHDRLTHAAAVRRIADLEAYSGARKAPACEAAHRYPVRCQTGMRPPLYFPLHSDWQSGCTSEIHIPGAFCGTV